MKRTIQILKVIQLFLFLPFSVENGSKKKYYQLIKKAMIDAKLF